MRPRASRSVMVSPALGARAAGAGAGAGSATGAAMVVVASRAKRVALVKCILEILLRSFDLVDVVRLLLLWLSAEVKAADAMMRL